MYIHIHTRTGVRTTYLSANPLKITLGGVPVKVATPPIFELKATANENVLAKFRNSFSFRARFKVELEQE